MFTLIICVALLSLTPDVVQSKSIETPELPLGITIHKVVSTWDEAHEQCKDKGAVMASPTTIELLNGMKSLISAKNTPYFIGTKLTQQPETFTSEEGIALTNMTAGVMDMVKTLDTRNGSCLAMDQDSIRVVPCCMRLPFMCFSELDVTRAKCGTDDKDYKYIASTGSCYKVHQEEITWQNSQKTCVAEKGHLVVIDDDNEAEVIKLLTLAAFPDFPHIYVGLEDPAQTGEWKSVTGKTLDEVYDGWYCGRPWNKDFHCGIFRSPGKLDNRPCYIYNHFICEKKMVEKKINEAKQINVFSRNTLLKYYK